MFDSGDGVYYEKEMVFDSRYAVYYLYSIARNGVEYYIIEN